MTSCSFGDVVLVSFPFTNQTGEKQRPAVVVSTAAYHQARPDLILMAITSRVRSPANFGEVILQDWQTAGLLKPSSIKPVIFTVEKTLILNVMGQLREEDRRAVEETLKVILG